MATEQDLTLEQAEQAAAAQQGVGVVHAAHARRRAAEPRTCRGKMVPFWIVLADRSSRPNPRESLLTWAALSGLSTRTRFRDSPSRPATSGFQNSRG